MLILLWTIKVHVIFVVRHLEEVMVQLVHGLRKILSLNEDVESIDFDAEVALDWPHASLEDVLIFAASSSDIRICAFAGDLRSTDVP